MANVFRVDNVYHQQCIIKYKKDDKLRKVLTEIDQHYKNNNKVNVEIDVEPNRL
jgi:primosomal protein N'